MRWAGHVARTGDRRYEGKKPLERCRCMGKDNIKVYLKEVGWGVDWIDLAGACECGNEPSGFVKYEEFID